MKCHKSVKNAHPNFPERNVTSSYASFVQTKTQNTDSSFIIISATEKQQILTIKRLNQQFFSLFYLKND